MEYPPVSVVMPVRNEERHLAEAVRHVLGQDYPGEFELVLAVGPSADRTEQIARDLAAAEPRLTVVANPAGAIPAALNARCCRPTTSRPRSPRWPKPARPTPAG
jgi:succinoglycan biosynthesis protein ExoA